MSSLSAGLPACKWSMCVADGHWEPLYFLEQKWSKATVCKRRTSIIIAVNPVERSVTSTLWSLFLLSVGKAAAGILLLVCYRWVLSFCDPFLFFATWRGLVENFRGEEWGHGDTHALWLDKSRVIMFSSLLHNQQIISFPQYISSYNCLLLSGTYSKI